MQKLPENTEKNVKIARHLGDVLMVINADVNGYKDLIKSYTTECFPEGLSLEGEDEECCYLETIIRNKKWDIQCQHRNKNANMPHQEFYRGKHAWSFHEDKHKFGAMIGTFLRIERNSSTTELAMTSMKEKIIELKALQYTDKQIGNTIRYLANKHPFSPLWYTTAQTFQ